MYRRDALEYNCLSGRTDDQSPSGAITRVNGLARLDRMNIIFIVYAPWA